jgi:ubiquinone/menaquinone biosynthesis C-methylase UbiE
LTHKMSSVDATAASFDRCRPLPGEVSAAIRSAVWSAAARLPATAPVLDIGAGTGRIGKAFVAAGDFYVGVDTSLAMLREFPAKPDSCFLAQADGRQLPFCNGAFDVVLLMHVLSGAGEWRELLNEARRVLRPGGSMVVGHTVSPKAGLDAQLKRRLTAILKEMGIAWHRPGESRRQALDWLDTSAVRHVGLQVASWSVNATVEEFLLRHRTGARFAALPVTVQEQALKKLRTWAETSLGSVDTGFQESRSFKLDIFEF